MAASFRDEARNQEEFSTKISEDINCSICLDILVRPHTLVPCGHSFCRKCCFQSHEKNTKNDNDHAHQRHPPVLFSKCPQCRESVSGMVRSRQLENLIDSLVTVPNLLFRNEDDKQEYEQRKIRECDNDAESYVSGRKRPRTNGCPYVRAHSSSRSTSQSHYSTHAGFPAGMPVPPPSIGSFLLSMPSARSRSEIRERAFRPPSPPSPPHELLSLYDHNDQLERYGSYYNPMEAPMPPPYDSSLISRSNQQRRREDPPSRRVTRPLSTDTTASTESASAQVCDRGQVRSGVSANDAICID